MDIFLNKFRLFIIVIMYINLDSIHSYSQPSGNFEGFHTGRRLLYSDWESAPSFYSPGGITPDNEPRAPIYLELTNNLTSVNGASGICGVCARIYRVLHMTQLNAAEECRRHHNSRQAAFGDITEFYHTLVKSGRLNGTIEFPLADKFSRFSFRTTILYLASRGNEPGLMIEAGSDTKYVLCVQSIKCPEPITTTTTSTTEALTTTLPTTALTNSNNSSLFLSLSPTSSQGRSGSGSTGNENDANNEHSNSAFWDTLLSGTEPKSWFLATISLASLCLLLIIMLIATWLYTCRLRRLYNRRRCHGTCRFGCRCPPEVVRQTAAEAAVCGPLGLQTHQQFTNTMSPQGNGSVRSGSGFGNTLYTGGTLNSGRWGSNGNKIGSPLYVALGSAPDKSALLSAGCNTPSYMLEMSAGLPINSTVDGCSGSCNQTNGKFRNTRLRPKRTSQDALRRSTSEGSSVSGATGTAGANNSVTGIDQSSFLYRSGQAVTFSDATMPNILPSMVVSNTNAGQRGTESTGTVYLQGGPNGYNYSDSGRGSGISPGYSHSPTHGNSRKVNDRPYFSSNSNSAGNSNGNNNNNGNIQNGLINSNGPINNMDEEEVESKCDMNYLGNQANKILSNLQSDHCNDYNNYNSESHNLPLHHLNRGSEADLLNITPPSGFYDFTNNNNNNHHHNNNQHNNSSTNGMVNSDSSYLVSSSLAHNMLTPSPRQQSSHIHQNRLISSPNSFGRQIFNQLPPSSGGLLPHSSGINGSNTATTLLYPIHGSPTSQGEWQNPMSFTKCNLQNGEMVGSTDEDFINGCPPIMLSTNNTTSDNSNTGTATRIRKYNTPNYNGNSNGGLRPLVTRPHFSDSLHSGVNHNLNENNSTTINNRSFHNSNDNAEINDTLITTSKVNRMCVGISERML